MLGTTLPLPEAPWTPAPWIRRLRSPPDQSARKRRGSSLTTTRSPRKQSLVCLLVTPLRAGCRGKCVIGSPRAHFSARASNRCDCGQNKTHTFSKREQISSSAYHKLALRQPVFKAVSTSWHVGRGLAGHPQCVRVGNGYNKTRLYTPIRSKTTALSQWARHHSAQRG